MSKLDCGFHCSRNRHWSDQGVTEEQLVQRARNGDSAAFKAIVLRYEHHIYALAYLITGNAEEASDLTRECFVRAYRGLSRTDPDLNIRTWLFRVAANACLAALRKRNRIRWIQRDGPWLESRSTIPIDDASASATINDVQRALGKMKDHHRLALILREYVGMSTTEIGEVMALSRSAVTSVLFRAREEFRSLGRIPVGESDTS